MHVPDIIIRLRGYKLDEIYIQNIGFIDGFRLILRRLFVNIIRLCRLYGLFDIIFGLNRLIR
jgi:hypothetical protein